MTSVLVLALSLPFISVHGLVFRVCGVVFGGAVGRVPGFEERVSRLPRRGSREAATSPEGAGRRLLLERGRRRKSGPGQERAPGGGSEHAQSGHGGGEWGLGGNIEPGPFRRIRGAP